VILGIRLIETPSCILLVLQVAAVAAAVTTVYMKGDEDITPLDACNTR
jgi:hypothetical protein